MTRKYDPHSSREPSIKAGSRTPKAFSFSATYFFRAGALFTPAAGIYPNHITWLSLHEILTITSIACLACRTIQDRSRRPSHFQVISTTHRSLPCTFFFIFSGFVSCSKLGRARARGVANIATRSEPPRAVPRKIDA